MTLTHEAPTVSRIPLRERPAAPPQLAEALQAVAAFGAAGLILYGLSRRSWTGSLLAVAGGWCLVNVVRASPPPAGAHRPSSAPPSLPIAEGETVIRARREPIAVENSPRAVAVLAAPVTELPDPTDGLLTADEHDSAAVGAYFIALERGGGSLPPYSETSARADFCRAAGEVRKCRTRG